MYTKQEDQGFGVKKAKAVGGDERILRTRQRAGYVAKRRMNLPDELALDWRMFEPFLQQQVKDYPREPSAKKRARKSNGKPEPVEVGA